MMLTIQLLLRLLWIRARRSARVLIVLAGAACFHAAIAEAQVVSNLFIYPFNPLVSKISITPNTRWGLFREADTITVSTTDNSSIRILAERSEEHTSELQSL